MKAVIFDCDGVLVDSEPISNRVWAEAVSELGHPITAAEFQAGFIGMSTENITRKIAATLGRAAPEDFGARTAARALAAILAELRPVPGAVESVERVKAAGRAVAVASSSDPRRLTTLLDGVGILPLVAPHAYSTALVARGKPAPDIFLHAADRLGVRPADCTVIEDTTTGVAAGVAAGMRVIGFLGGGHAGPELGARLRATGAGTLARDHATLGAMLLELAA